MRLVIFPMIISFILITCPASASLTGEEILRNKLSVAMATYNLAPQLTEVFIAEMMVFFKISPDTFTQFLLDVSNLVVGYKINSQGGVTVTSVGTGPGSTTGQIFFTSE